MVTRVRSGETKKAAIAIAAHELGRPEAGTAFRAHHKLKARIDAALTEAAMGQAQTETPEIPEAAIPPSGASAEGDTAVGGHARAAVQAPDLDARSKELAEAHAAPTVALTHTASPIVAHIMTLPTKGGWTLERDLELMELSIQNWQPNEIALQLQIQASLIKPRFDLLTGLYKDANDKKVRRFKREDVYEALKSLTAGKAA